MVNRNAARHLLFVVSILLCFFIYMGYRLFGKGSAEPAAPDATNELASFPGAADGSSLRPQGTSASGLKPPSAVADMGDWIPSARGEELALAPAPTSPVSAPPGGGSLFDGMVASSSSSPSGAITGLIPAPPGGASSSSPVRPPTDALPPQMTPPGGVPSMPLENMEDVSAFASSAAGLKPPDAGTSLPVPSFGGTDAPMEMGGESSMPAAPESTAPVRPPVDAAPSYTPPAPGGYTYQEEESAPPAPVTTRPPVPPPATRTTPPATADTRPSPPPPTRPTPPARPVQTDYDDYGYEDDDDDDDLSSGSESLRIYVVRPGDTLSNIAARELGSISLADNIFLLNRDVIEDPDQLMVGVKIRLPVREGYVAESGGAPGGDRRPTLGTGRTHTVARGDTLSSIAQQYYGASAAWRFLYEANKNIIPSPDKLSVGTELTIPPYEEN